jgi:hypothetical protein
MVEYGLILAIRLEEIDGPHSSEGTVKFLNRFGHIYEYSFVSSSIEIMHAGN